ncbi:hypothetical protein A8709_07355 [Paenibacillus pectinilyticus]|uniref:HAMP domain-containing protein n=1 Tax=Paenibacillus pectinilyticus TaxID=512399 RepID=A0A1C0ZTS7_9BACL|nr:histidine kinase [Paenibacillus pectinilyticus]OCT11477.1 hypothetical protein A8709_07355 [Paenibacillus pectinilyticus]
MRRINLLSSFTFYRRIQLSFLFLILLPTVVASFLNYSITQKSAMEKNFLSNQTLITVIANNISKMIDDMTYASNFFIQDENIRKQLLSFMKMARIESSDDLETYIKIKGFFNQVDVKTMNPDILMFWTNEEGFIVQSYIDNPNFEPEVIKQQYEDVKSRVDMSKPNILQWLGTAQTLINAKTSSNSYLLARVLKSSSDDQQIGTLFISIPDRYFTKSFSQLGSSKLAVFDAKGLFIAGNPDVSYSTSANNRGNIRNESTIQYSGWKLISETPKALVTSEIKKSFFLTLLIVIPFFLVFLLISIIVAKRLHRPIRRLQSGVKQFGNGNRSIRFEESGKDEITELGRTLNIMLNQINQLIQNIEQEQEQKRELEFQALYSQIRPHFLLNTLNSIKCNLAIDNEMIHSQKIDSLMSLLRAYMKFNEPTNLRNECKLLISYVDIMQMRSDMEVEIDIQLSPLLAEMSFPKLLLQPIVENAFVHGFNEDIVQPRISLQAEMEEGWIEIRIADNGIGMSEDKIKKLNSDLQISEGEEWQSYKRVGLWNVLQRLKMTFGSNSSIECVGNEVGGLTIVLGFHQKVDEGGSTC